MQKWYLAGTGTWFCNTFCWREIALGSNIRILLARKMSSRFFDVEPKSENAGNGVPAQRIALVVGNGSYTGGRLKNAVADAEMIGATLGRLGFDVTLLANGTKPQIEHAVIDFGLKLRRAGHKAVGLFYFAGHGIQFSGQNFLIPVDADIPDIAFLPSGAVSVQLLIEELAKSPFAAKVVILDACRNNPLPDATRSTRDMQRGLASMRDVPDATLIVFSTSADTVALDGSADHGPYATALADALPTPGRMLHEVMFDVSRRVIEATDGVQRPALFVQGAMPAVTLVDGVKAKEPSTTAPTEAPSGAARSTEIVREKNAPAAPSRGRSQVPLGLGLAAAIALGGAAFWLWPQSPEVTSSAAGSSTAERSAPPLAAAHARPEGPRVAAAIPPVTLPPVPPVTQSRPADPTRMALPVAVLKVADQLGLSTAVAEMIFLQSAVGLIEAKRYAATIPDLRSLAEAGQPIAQFWLGYVYYKGWGVPQDMDTALTWSKAAAEQGLPFAQQVAGVLLMDPKRSAADHGLGTLWLNFAAKQGDQAAVDTLKTYKLRPNPNTPSLDAALKAFDDKDGAKVLREAKVFVDNHSGFAAYLSGRVLFEGIGIEANPTAGVELLRVAARQQVGESMEMLAQAYGEGRGVEKNPIEALAWARLAVRNTLDAKHAATLVPTAARMRAAVSDQQAADLGQVLPAVGESR
jgi:TPR repeat protein